MFKPLLALIALTTTTACIGVDGGATVSRNYTGSLNGCPGVTGISAQYSRSVAGMPVRCGPQTASPVSFQ
jgi:hypothetical protein